MSVMYLIQILSIFYYFSSFLSSPLHSILHTLHFSQECPSRFQGNVGCISEHLMIYVVILRSSTETRGDLMDTMARENLK